MLNYKVDKEENGEEELLRDLGARNLIDVSTTRVVRKKTGPQESPIFFIICESKDEVGRVEERRNKILKDRNQPRLPYLLFRDRPWKERKSRPFLGGRRKILMGERDYRSPHSM